MTETVETTRADIMEAVPLSADDLSAMRMADSFTLHTSPNLDAGNGSILRLYTRELYTPKGKVYSPRQQLLFPLHMYSGTRAREIVIAGGAHGYGNSTLGNGDVSAWNWPGSRTSEDPEPTPQCFYSGHGGYEGAGTWSTIVRALRVGSLLTVVWTGDNNNQILNDAGLHADQVELHATTGKRTDRWSIGWSCGLDNSARMVKRTTR